MRQLVALFLLLLSTVVAAQATVEGLEYQTATGQDRLVLSTTGPVDHSLFTLDNPHRLVLDLKNARIGKGVELPSGNHPYVKKVRTGIQNGYDLRIVFDLKQEALPKSSVRQLDAQGQQIIIALSGQAPTPLGEQIKPAKQVVNSGRDIVIAIDAGHGGKDPGAIGPGGTKEKDVTLAVARKLADEINREPGMRAVLVRDSDRFIRLRDRIVIARRQGADLFVSIHADAFRDPRVSGSSVFTLSRGGASSEVARWLADKENAADLVGGVSLDDKDDMLASVLLDLSQSATLQAGNEVAENVFGKLNHFGKVHGSGVQRAGFAVLKAPDIPSILIETAFISNPAEERKLRNSSHQARIANTIKEGIRSYFHTSPPLGTKLAARLKREGGRHEVSQGDTLSAIAVQYNVSMDLIRSYNALDGDQLRVGQTLIIPRQLM